MAYATSQLTNQSRRAPNKCTVIVEVSNAVEALAQTLEEPFISGGTAPKIEKFPPATFIKWVIKSRMGDG